MKSQRFLYFFIVIWLQLACQAAEDFQYFNGFYKRVQYDRMSFNELYFNSYYDPEFTLHDYKYTIQKGLVQYFTLLDLLDKLRRFQSGVESFPITDQIFLDFNSTSPAVVHRNVTFNTAHGFTQMHFDNQLWNQGGNYSQNTLEYKWAVQLPIIVFKGSTSLLGSNRSLELSLNEVIYENKKLDSDETISLSLGSEKFYINSTSLKIDGQPPAESANLKLRPEIVKSLPKLLNNISSFLRTASANVSLAIDRAFIDNKKKEMMEKLSDTITRTFKAFGMFNVSIPRFSFFDEESEISYDFISGVLEVDPAKSSNISVTTLSNTEFNLSVSSEGCLTYFVTEQNCTDSCHAFGDRLAVRNLSALVIFAGKKLEKITLTLGTESNQLVAEHYLRKPTDSVTKSMMSKIVKILSDKLIAKVRNFLK